MLEGAGFYLVFQPLWGSEHLCSEPSFPTRPSTSLAPTTLQAKSHKSSPSPYLNLSRLCKQSRSSSLLQDLGYGVISLQVTVQESMCCGAPDHGEVQERYVLRVQVESGFARQQVSILQGRVFWSQLEQAQSEQRCVSFLTTPGGVAGSRPQPT